MYGISSLKLNIATTKKKNNPPSGKLVSQVPFFRGELYGWCNAVQLVETLEAVVEGWINSMDFLFMIDLYIGLVTCI